MAERLAFGEDEMDGCKCPARAVGKNPKDVGEVVALYDTFATGITGIGWGTLERERALDIWASAIDECNSPGTVEQAEEILEELREE